MKKFKIAVSKANKKYTLVLGAENEELAKQRAHWEWYSILSVEEYIEDATKHKFIFEGEKDWNIQKWQIIWDDIFKVYVKLRKSLWYNLNYLYSEDEWNITDEKKASILKQLTEEFDILKLHNKKQNKDKTSLINKVKKEKEEQKNLDSFYMKKELEETYKLIDFILTKIEKLITNTKLNLSSDQRDKLKNLYNSIIKIKKSTNIAKLKEIWERALLKVWKIELEELENQKWDYIEDQLNQTNKLLKSIGSHEQFKEKEKDIKYIISKNIKNISDFFSDLKEKKKKIEVDVRSHSYIKNKLFLRKYKERLSQNTLYIIKNLFQVIFNKTKRDDIFLKRKVIKQNITLLSVKQKGVWFSYTTIVKWYDSIIKQIVIFFKFFQSVLLFIVAFQAILIIFYIVGQSLWYTHSFNTLGILYSILILIWFICLYMARNLILIILNFVFFGFITIFFVVNF